MDASCLAPGRARVLLLMAAACVGLGGISGCGESSGPTGGVSGKITNQGQPLTGGAIVTFTSDSGGVATGVVEEGGAYRLRTPEGEGVPVGEYKVFLGPPSPAPIDPAAARAAKLAGKTDPEPPAWNVPEKYRQAATSGWSASVKEGDNTFDFAM